MPQPLFEHFSTKTDNQQIFRKNTCYFFPYRQHIFVELSLFHILWMLDISKVQVSMIEISWYSKGEQLSNFSRWLLWAEMTTNKTGMLIQLGILWYKHKTFPNCLPWLWKQFRPALFLHNSNAHMLILLKVLNRVI